MLSDKRFPRKCGGWTGYRENRAGGGYRKGTIVSRENFNNYNEKIQDGAGNGLTRQCGASVLSDHILDKLRIQCATASQKQCCLGEKSHCFCEAVAHNHVPSK
jgi:hypothetical protein